MPQVPPTYRSVPLDVSADAFGLLRRSDDISANPDAQKQRLDEDGYLYFPGYLDIDAVRRVRSSIFESLAAEQILDPDYPTCDGIGRQDAPASCLDYRPGASNEFVQEHGLLRELLFAGPVMDFWQKFFAGPVTSLNHIWLRVKQGPLSKPTPPHCDILYMGRGTPNVYTSWIPYVDVDFDMGGIMILEGSHTNSKLRESYCKRDVDVYCENSEDAELIRSGGKVFQRTGEYSLDAIATRSELGGRWLTTEFEMGDLLIFSAYTLHASLDNRTRRVRLSTDTRYQSALAPADERWIGAMPVGHGPAAKIAIRC